MAVVLPGRLTWAALLQVGLVHGADMGRLRAAGMVRLLVAWVRNRAASKSGRDLRNL
jgi:hypothetical protein